MMFSKEEIANEMKIFLDEKDIYIDEPMSKHTTFKIGGKADIFVKLRNTYQIENLLKLCFIYYKIKKVTACRARFLSKKSENMLMQAIHKKAEVAEID